jgi:O-antigen ligase
MNINKTLLIAFGFLLSIEQGFTVVLGTLSNGVARGADVIMPVDLAIYALLLVKPSSTTPKRTSGIFSFALTFAVLFLAWTSFGEFVAIEKADFRFGLVHLARAILVFICILTRVSSKQDMIEFSKGVIYGLGFEALIGVWQWQIGPVSLPFINVVNTWRATGTIGVANALGLFLATLAPLSIRMAMFTKVKPKWLWYTISVLSMGALLATYTRGAWVAFAISMIIFLYIDFLNKKLTTQQANWLLIVIVLAAVFTTVKYGNVITGRMEHSKEAIVSDKKHSRVGLAKDSIRIIRENKITGVGLNNYRYHADIEIQGTRIVHNVYLLVAAQQGIPGAVIFIVLNLTVFIAGFRIMKSRDPVLYHIGMGCLTGMLVIFIYYFIAPDYRLVILKLHHWRALAMIIAVLAVDDRTRQLRLRMAQIKRRKKANLAKSQLDGTSQIIHETTL